MVLAILDGGLVAKLDPILETPWVLACQAPLSMGFSRQECRSVWSFTSPGDLPDPGIDSGLTWQADSLPTELRGNISARGQGFDPLAGSLGKSLTEWHYVEATTGGPPSRREGGQENSRERSTGEGPDMSDTTQQPNRASLGQTVPKGLQHQLGVLIAPELTSCISRRHRAVSRGRQTRQALNGQKKKNNNKTLLPWAIFKNWGFPGGSVVKNPPASAGDTGSIPGLGRFHMPWSN